MGEGGDGYLLFMDFRSERSLSRGARATETALPTKKMTKILRPRTFSFSYDRSPPHGRERSIQLDCFKNVARICQFLQARASYAPFLDFGAHIYIYSNGEGISSRRYPCGVVSLAFSRVVPSPTERITSVPFRDRTLLGAK